MAALPYQLVGGHVALDLVNTVDWRGDPARRQELLATFDDLLAWAQASTVATPAEVRTMQAAARRDPLRAERALKRARRLRELLARALAAASRGVAPSAGDVRRLNAFLAAALAHRQLDVRRTSVVWSWSAGPDETFDALLWPVVLAAAELLTSDDRSRIHECGGDGCGWLFLDTSRNGRRRWCTMQGCGNRAKARRFYERTRTRETNERTTADG